MYALLKKWWVVFLRGLLAIFFGVAAFVWPGLTLLALVLMFGIYAVAEGFMAIWISLIGRDGGGSLWALLPAGVFSILAGIFAWTAPAITIVVFLIVIAAWAIVRGILEIVAAIRLRKEIKHEWLLAFAGILSIAFGVLLMMRPGVGLVSLIWITGAYAIAFGLLGIVLSFRMRHLLHQAAPPPQPA